MRIKIFVFLFLLLSLYSCWNSEEEIITLWNDTLIKFENTFFEIMIPTNWNILKDNENILPKPKNWEISLATTSDELKYGFSNNLLILSQNLNKVINSLDFSVLNNVWASRDYLEYIKLESKNIVFSDNDKSMLYIFEAKYNQTTPKLKFLQIWKVCSINKAHLLTIAISNEIKDTSKYEELLKTFKCK